MPDRQVLHTGVDVIPPRLNEVTQLATSWKVIFSLC